jgi:predicted nucleic acid-binding protein
MKRSVMADTGPLYAAVDPDDLHHQRARQELKQLTREKREVVIAYPTLLEAYTLVLFRLGNATALRWLSEINGSATLINPGPEDYRKAAARTQGLADQPVTLFDATVAVLSLRLGMEIWTYDHHFDLMRTAVWRGFR